jgi:hypothetical protein
MTSRDDVNVLLWHVHGSWTTSFVAGPQTTLLPVVPDRGPDGRGRAATWDWPERAVERTPEQLADEHVDVVVVQRPHELALAERWLGGRRPGRDLPLVWLEHNTPPGATGDVAHPARDRDDVVVVHVTATNRLYWDTGCTRTTVIDHGVADPGHRWTGESDATAVVINEPARRGRAVGADLLPTFGAVAPIDLFGMGVDRYAQQLAQPTWLRTHVDLPQVELHDRMRRCRCYLHPYRWTSLGLSLIEAMLLGLPIVALASTEVPDAVTRSCGAVTNDVEQLCSAIRRLGVDRDLAAAQGAAARRRALDRYGLDRFLTDWEVLLASVAA